MTYAYDAANRPITMTQGANTYAYTYTGLGDRVKQKVNSVVMTYTLDLNAGLTQVLTDTANVYLYGNGRIAQYAGASASYFLGDALGSVRQLANGSGSVTLAKSYQPYGTVMSSSGAGSSMYGFTGEITDATGLVHLRARYLSTGTGRFVTRDTWAGDANRPMSYNKWLYATADPINYTDPSGLCVLCNAGDHVRVNGAIDIYASADPRSAKLGRLTNGQYIQVATSRPIPIDFTAGGTTSWRKIIIPPDPFDDVPSTQFGWVRNIALLDNCTGPFGQFGCLPLVGWSNESYGFGPNDYAKR